jgi:O-antigen ligase
LSQCLRLTNLTPIIASFCFPATILFISIGLSKVFSVVLDLLIFLPPGIISDDAITKTRQQFNGSFGLLFGGRQEIFSSYYAWEDKPFFGWGSWAQDPNSKYRYIGYETMGKLGYDFDFEKEFKAVELGFTSTYIPTHSVILSLLAWGGILSTIPFYVFLSNYISQFLKIISQKNLSPPFFVSYAFINSLWNIAFSPFGFTNRLGIAISCALVISYSKEMSILHHKTLTTGAINS